MTSMGSALAPTLYALCECPICSSFDACWWSTGHAQLPDVRPVFSNGAVHKRGIRSECIKRYDDRVNTDLLWEIVRDTTAEFRKGAAVTTDTRIEGVDVVHVYAMPHADHVPPELEQVDVHFEIVGVDKNRAEARRADLLGVLREWPDDRLAAGPSYIEAGGVVGDQGVALRLYALGQVLGFWQVITPERLGMTGETAERAAGAGYVMVTGFRDPELRA